MTQNRGLIVAVLGLSLACSRSKSEPTVDTLGVVLSTPNTGSETFDTASRTANACPRTGLWAQCSVEKRLSQSGFVVRRVPDSAKRRSGFSVMPIPYILGRSRLDVFIYPTADAVTSETSRLDTALAGPRGVRSQWGVGVQPTFVRSANLIAVFLTDNPTQSERLSLALTAGPPQP
jgi:hypothetical protein